MRRGCAPNFPLDFGAVMTFDGAPTSDVWLDLDDSVMIGS